MTSRGQCPRGCVLVNVKEWGSFSIFRRADDVTRTMSKGGVHPRLCSTYPSSDPPPHTHTHTHLHTHTHTHTWMAGYGPGNPCNAYNRLKCPLAPWAAKQTSFETNSNHV